MNSHLGGIAVGIFRPGILFKYGADFGLAPVPAVAQFVPDRSTLSFERFDIRVRLWNNRQRRILGKFGNVAKEFFRRKPVFYRERGHDRRAQIEVAPPEIISDLVQKVALIHEEFRIEKFPALKCPISQHPLREAMDSVNGSAVETLQGNRETALCLLI